MRNGILQRGGCCVVGEGVFFTEERPAAIFAERTNKNLIKVEGGRVDGWLAQNPL